MLFVKFVLLLDVYIEDIFLVVVKQYTISTFRFHHRSLVLC